MRSLSKALPLLTLTLVGCVSTPELCDQACSAWSRLACTPGRKMSSTGWCGW